MPALASRNRSAREVARSPESAEHRSRLAEAVDASFGSATASRGVGFLEADLVTAESDQPILALTCVRIARTFGISEQNSRGDDPNTHIGEVNWRRDALNDC